jgi:endonuclease-3
MLQTIEPAAGTLPAENLHPDGCELENSNPRTSMSTAQKSRDVQKVITQLKKRYDVPGRREPLPVLEQLILAVLADGSTTAQADAVFHRLKQNYFDWNEVRVSAVVELQEHLRDLPDPEQRAARLKGCLKFIFETTYGFELETLQKIPMKEVARKFERMPGVSDYLVARVIRDGLGGTAMPLDTAAVRVLTRLGIVDEKTPPQVLSASLARQIPRARSFEFCHLLSELAADTCVEVEPRCKPCVLVDDCPTGQRRLAEMAAAAAAEAAAAKAAAEAAKKKKARAKAKKVRAKSR